MGNTNSNSNFSQQEKDIYLREIKRLTDQNRNLYPTINTSGDHNPINYTDKQRINIQNQLLMTQMQKQIAQNQAEINRLRSNNTGNFQSNYSKIAQQHTNNNINPQVIHQILRNPSANLSPQERNQLQNYLNSFQKSNQSSQLHQLTNGSRNNQYNQRYNPQYNQNQQPNQSNNKLNQSNTYQRYNQSNTYQRYNQTNQQNNTNHQSGFMHQNMGTRNYYDKNIVKVDLDNSLESITKSYYDEEEQARIQFELDENKRRQEFEERQKKRRVEFNSKLRDFELGPVNAQKLFNLPDGYTLEQLNKAYKKLAIRTHPDRNGGSNEDFRVVTKSYMLLMEKYKQKEQDKSYFDLKRNADSFFKKQKENRTRVGVMDKDRFNLKLFNKIYEENRLYEPNDEGYGNWFQTEENTYEQPKIFSDKFNLGIFNTVFEQQKQQQSSKQLEKRIDNPNALMSKSNNINFTELGGGDISNFGKDTVKKDDLNFSDLREAYTKTHLINPNSGEYRKDYKNIEELKKARANISFTPDQQTLERQERQRIMEREMEDRRVNRLRAYDNVVEKHYQNVHNQMLGFNPDVEKQLTYD